MDIKGKIIQVLPIQNGTSKKGNWKKQEFILETLSQYPKKIYMFLWNDKVDQFPIQQGDTVKVSIDIESREFNNRWYTDIRAWRIEKHVPEQGGSYESESHPQEPAF